MGEMRSATIDCLRQDIRIFDNKEGTSFRLDVHRNNTILDEVTHFTNSITRKSNHRNPGSVGASNVAVLESMKKSMEEEKTVNVRLGN